MELSRYLPHVPNHHVYLEQSPEASFRIKRSDFDPTIEWRADQGEPGTHIVMAVFGCLIYELNKCDESFSEANVSACAWVVTVCSSYADKKDDFRSSMQARPLKSVLAESKKLLRYKEEKLSTSQTAEACKRAVTSMATVKDLCAVIANLVTNAKASEQDNGASMRCSSILNALEEFKRADCKIGKLRLVFVYILYD